MPTATASTVVHATLEAVFDFVVAEDTPPQGDAPRRARAYLC